MRRLKRSANVPKDSYYYLIKKSFRLNGVLKSVKDIHKHFGNNLTKSQYCDIFETQWSENIFENEWSNESIDYVLRQLFFSYKDKKEELVEYFDSDSTVFSQKVTKEKVLSIGDDSYCIRQLSTNILLANTMQDIIAGYYYLYGAKELSPCNDLLDEFTSLSLEYDLKELPMLTWVSLKGFGLKSSGHCYDATTPFDNVMGREDIVGVMVINFNEIYKRSWYSGEGDVSTWDKISYILNWDNEVETDIKRESYKDHLCFAVFTTMDAPYNFAQNGMFISHYDDVQQKIDIISEGLGESLGGSFMPGCGRKVGLNEPLSWGVDLSDYGLAFDLALKSIKYSQDAEKISSKDSFLRPNHSKSSSARQSKRNKKKKVKTTNQYFNIEYLSIPKEDNLPQWFKESKPSTPRAKSIDPRFMSSHYRRIWVTDSYIEMKEIPEEQILAVDENRPRRNKKGDLIYKKRSLVAIKIDTGHEPLATVTRLT